MLSEGLLVELNAGVLSLTLKRPEKRNVLDMATRKILLASMKAHERSDDVRCVVISSEGSVFSGGADLRHILSLTRSKAREYTKFVRSLLDYIEAYPKPTIGLVNGAAVGGGLELLLALDVVLATPNAKFGLPELNVGLIPGGGGSQRLPRFVGMRKAKEMIFSGSLISAEEAFAIGLVSRVVPEERLEEEARRLCQQIISKSPMALRQAKVAINRSFFTNLSEGLRCENALYESVIASSETKERIKDFLENKKDRPRVGS